MALAAAVPLGTNRAVQREVQHLRQQTQGIPLVAGAGDAGQTDLVLAALDFDPRSIPTAGWGLVEAARQDVPNGVLPLHLGHKASGVTLVGTESEIASTLGLRLASGRWCIRPGEIVASPATMHPFLRDQPKWTPRFSTLGQIVESEAPRKFALQAPPTQRLRVVGRCEPTGSAADEVAWIQTSPPRGSWMGCITLIKRRQKNQRRQPRGDKSWPQITPLVRNLYEQDGSGLHAHVPKSELPLHLLRITPQDQRSRTMVRTNLKLRLGAMTAVPEKVADELAATVRSQSPFGTNAPEPN